MKAIEIEMEGEDENKEPEEYEICDWYKTLVKAEEIKADAKKMKYVAEYAETAKKVAIDVAKMVPKKASGIDGLKQAIKDKPEDAE